MTDPIPVLVVSHTSELWGAELRLLDTAQRLGRFGFELRLAAPPGRFLDAWEAADLPTAPLALPRHQGLRRSDGTGRPSPRQLAQEAAVVLDSAWHLSVIARPARLIHSHSLSANLDVALAGRLARRPTVLDVHDIVRPGVGRNMLRIGSRIATATIANSKATANTLGERPTSRVRVVYPGVDLERFTPGPCPQDIRRQLTGNPASPLVGILGRVDPDKGVDVLVRAVAALRDPWSDAHLVVVGAGALDENYATDVRALAESRLGDRVRFAGARSDIPAVLRSLDILVNASACEPFGRTVLEAQASGVPVIGTNAGGIPEFLTDRASGVLVPPGDADALQEAIEVVLGDTKLRRQIIAGGVEAAGRSFSAEEHSRAVAEVYRWALSPSGLRQQRPLSTRQSNPRAHFPQ